MADMPFTRASLGLLICFLLTVLGLGTAAWFAAGGGPDAARESDREYYHSFKGDPNNSQGLELFGPRAAQCVMFEPEGLRITVPPGPQENTGSGVKTGIGVTGDFEVTMSFEVLEEPEPAQIDAGVRLNLVVSWEMPGSDFNGAILSRKVAPKSGTTFGTWFQLRDEASGKNKSKFDSFPTKAKKGQLRLVRSGSLLSYYVLEDSSDHFTLLQSYPISKNALNDVRIVGMRAGSQEALVFRVGDLRIRGDSLRNLPTAHNLEGKGWLVITLACMLAITFAVAGWFTASQRRRRQRPAPAGAKEEPPQPESAPAAGSLQPPQAALRTVPAGWARLYLWLPPVGFLAVLGAGLITFGVTRGSSEVTELEFYHDFRGRPIPSTFKFFGEPKGKFLKVEPEGLRITLPRSYIHPFGGVGLVTTFGFRGDFEVTTTLEVLHADQATEGFGVGAGVRVQMAPPQGALLVRLARPNAGQVVYWDRIIEHGKFDSGMTPSTDQVVRLRLKRTGRSLSYLLGRGKEGDDFQEVNRWEVPEDDIQSVRLSSMTGRLPYNVDVRFIDLRIRSIKSQVAAAFKWNLWLAAAILVLIFMLAVCGPLYARQRRRAGQSPASPSKDSAQVRFEPSAPAVCFLCASCGKKLKARGELAGKRVKCPHRGQATQVPHGDPGLSAPSASVDRPTSGS